MAYFPNSTEGEILERQCEECLHDDEDILCPIYNAQASHNYGQCDNKALEGCLEILVSKEGDCQMKPLIDKIRKAGSKARKP